MVHLRLISFNKTIWRNLFTILQNSFLSFFYASVSFAGSQAERLVFAVLPLPLNHRRGGGWIIRHPFSSPASVLYDLLK